jgi:hypothetical protein
MCYPLAVRADGHASSAGEGTGGATRPSVPYGAVNERKVGDLIRTRGFAEIKQTVRKLGFAVSPAISIGTEALIGVTL